MLTILENDRQFASELPKYTVVTASAGSGKTRALKQRFAQLLLSRSVPNNNLKNILAITFTNNAAREMKQRVLDSLKSASLGRPETLEELQSLLTLTPSELQLEAGRLIDEILDNYSDFQIRTIDSFLTRVFKASALELGLSPELEIVLDSDTLLDEAFSLFARGLSEGTQSARLFGELLDLLMESRAGDERFLWNPYTDLSDKVKGLYKRVILTSKRLRREDFSSEIGGLGDQLVKDVKALDALVSRPNLTKTKRFEEYVNYAKARDVASLIGHKFPSPPIKKSESKADAYQHALRETEGLGNTIAALRRQLIVLEARQHFQPYAEAHALLTQSLERVKRDRGQVDIGDVIKRLAEYLKPGIVPEVYYSLGESLCHYLIDEFQDTNPIQWESLEPLISNALATHGSLFVVGDTKQSIYGFRGADWRIMRRLQTENVFASAVKDLKVLNTNCRSFEKILRFNDDVFKTGVPGKVIEGAAEASGLSTDEQLVRDSFVGKGYVEITSIAADSPEGNDEQNPQKDAVLQTVADCLARGYRSSDITILSPRNSDIIEISGWLNEKGISFISHSSLDVRSRKVTGELLAFLRFLDSPIDDLSFATFLLGDLFAGLLRHQHTTVSRQQFLDFLFEHRVSHRHRRPLYVTFRHSFPELWHRYFEELFNVVGYLPTYDLISEIYKTFDVFALLPTEEASLAKVLEVVKDFEEKGENSLKGFLRYASDSPEDADWNIDIPTDVDAVKVMTIHKAKGLESRVVIVLLFDSSPRRESLYFEEGDEEVRLIRLTKGGAEESDELRELYHQKTLSQTVDDLNKLYVAFTRAGEEMYVISVKAKRGTTPSEFLPESGYGPQPRPTVLRPPAVAETRVELCHQLPRRPLLPTEYAGISITETRRGEFVHAVLESIITADENLRDHLEEAVQRARTRMPFEGDTAGLCDTLVRALTAPEIHPYFRSVEGRRVLNEQEFAAPDGALVRMDRVVVDPGTVTVIDYKTGDEKLQYTEQVAKYMKILRSFYTDRPVLGVLVYIDRKSIHRVA